jgi:trans-aconitate 2-methyltransferase
VSRPRDWDAATYDRIADPMTEWGSSVVSRLELGGNELVLDAGCGSGRVTEQLLARLPRGRVIALDGSPSMLEQAAARLAAYADRVELVQADLRLPLPVGPVDAVLSTATFHWIPDHPALFEHMAAALRPGGRLEAQCGGAGNIASILAILATLGDGWTGPWTFATPEETASRLAAAGFSSIRTWLQPEPTPVEPGEPTAAYLRTVILGDHLARLPVDEREPFVAAVASRLPRPLIDYVRLNISARRGS